MDEEIRLSLGARLREERERLGLSQSAFGALGSVSLRTEQDWERGVSAVKSDFLAVAAAHGVDVLYVVTGVRMPVLAVDKREQALLDNYKASDESGKRVIEGTANLAAQPKAKASNSCK